MYTFERFTMDLRRFHRASCFSENVILSIQCETYETRYKLRDTNSIMVR